MSKLILKKESKEVYYCTNRFPSLDYNDLKKLLSITNKNIIKKARFCLHKSKSSRLHKMVIAHKKGVQVPLHKHLHSEELLLLLHGKLKLLFFSESGHFRKEVCMCPVTSKAIFIQVIPKNTYHTINILTDYVIFLEIILGPFKPKNMKIMNKNLFCY